MPYRVFGNSKRPIRVETLAEARKLLKKKEEQDKEQEKIKADNKQDTFEVTVTDEDFEKTLPGEEIPPTEHSDGVPCLNSPRDQKKS